MTNAEAETLPTRVGDMTKPRIRLSMQRGTFERGRALDPGSRLLVTDVESGHIIACETLWAGVRYDEKRRNKLGQPGAYVTVWPDDGRVASLARRLIEEHRVTEQRDRRLNEMGVPMLPS